MLSDSVLTAEVIANSPGEGRERDGSRLRDCDTSASYEPINTVTAYTPGAGGYTVPDSVAGVGSAVSGVVVQTGESNAAVVQFRRTLPTTSDEILDLFVGSGWVTERWFECWRGWRHQSAGRRSANGCRGRRGGAGFSRWWWERWRERERCGFFPEAETIPVVVEGWATEAQVVTRTLANDGASGGLRLSGGGSGGMGGGDNGGAGGAGGTECQWNRGNAGADTYAGGGGGAVAEVAVEPVTFGDGGGGGGSIGPSLSGIRGAEILSSQRNESPGSPGALVITALAQPMDLFAAPGPGPGHDCHLAVGQ